MKCGFARSDGAAEGRETIKRCEAKKRERENFGDVGLGDPHNRGNETGYIVNK